MKIEIHNDTPRYKVKDLALCAACVGSKKPKGLCVKCFYTIANKWKHNTPQQQPCELIIKSKINNQ